MHDKKHRKVRQRIAARKQRIKLKKKALRWFFSNKKTWRIGCYRTAPAFKKEKYWLVMMGDIDKWPNPLSDDVPLFSANA